jgi:hypothetical protein
LVQTSADPKIKGLRTRATKFSSTLDRKDVSGIYRGLKDAFQAGRVHPESRRYLFLQQQAYTRYNLTGYLDKAGALAWEWLAGYGLRPLRVLSAFVILYLLALIWFSLRLGRLDDSLILSAGGFLTFGAKTDLLNTLSLWDHIVYVVSAFLGISLIALFITVMANVHLRNK